MATTPILLMAIKLTCITGCGYTNPGSGSVTHWFNTYDTAYQSVQHSWTGGTVIDTEQAGLVILVRTKSGKLLASYRVTPISEMIYSTPQHIR